MYKQGLKLKLKAESQDEDLPKTLTVATVTPEAVFVINEENETIESQEAILNAFYDKAEELTVENLPTHVVEALKEVVGLFDMYAATQHPTAGIQVKSKLIILKEEIEKLTGAKSSATSLLGRKVA
jgi:hypothetical protein